MNQPGLQTLGDALLREMEAHEPPMLDDRAKYAARQRVIRSIEAEGQRAVQRLLAGSGRFDAVTADGFDRGRNEGQAAAQVRISGSYRVGVASVADDIDAVLVVPRVDPAAVAREMEEGLVRRCKATRARRIEGAQLVILDVEMLGIPVDLTIAAVDAPRLPATPAELDLLDDEWLRGASAASVQALNGPRCTERYVQMVLDTVGGPSLADSTNPMGSMQRGRALAMLRNVLRFLRCLCRRREVYGNKFGYLGGINCAILATLGCLRWGAVPQAHWVEVATRLCELVGTWEYQRDGPLECAQRPVLVRSDFTTPSEPWNPARQARDRRDVAPILSPCFPVTNTWASASPSSLAEVQREFRRAACVLRRAQDSFVPLDPYRLAHLGGPRPGASRADMESAAAELFRPARALAQGQWVLRVRVGAPGLQAAAAVSATDAPEADVAEADEDGNTAAEVPQGDDQLIPEAAQNRMAAVWRRYAEWVSKDCPLFSRIRVVTRPLRWDGGIVWYLVAASPPIASCPGQSAPVIRVPAEAPSMWLRNLGWPEAALEVRAELELARSAEDLGSQEQEHLGRADAQGPPRLGDGPGHLFLGDRGNRWVDAGTWGLLGAKVRPHLGPEPPPPTTTGASDDDGSRGAGLRAGGGGGR